MMLYILKYQLWKSESDLYIQLGNCLNALCSTIELLQHVTSVNEEEKNVER